MKWLGFQIVILLLMTSCSQSARSLYERAEKESANQRGQLARYLYVQVIERHSSKDELRFRALKGLADLCFDQLHDYREGMKAVELAVNEFKDSKLLETELNQLKIKASFVARVHLQDPEKALELIQPMIDKDRLSESEWQEVGRVYLDLRNFESAESAFQRSWDMASKSKDCGALRKIQLDLMQTYALSKNCQKSLQWAEMAFPEGCRSDTFSVRLEMGHCMEILGEVDRAMKLYESMMAENPQNYRAQTLLENIKRRQKEKQSR